MMKEELKEQSAFDGRPVGCALALRVMQSNLYPALDEAERADCDALIRKNLDWASAPTPPKGQA